VLWCDSKGEGHCQTDRCVHVALCYCLCVCVCVGVGVGVCVCAHMCGCACLAVVEVARIDGMYPRQISISWWIGSTAILHV
jgi:hypothetical protein